MDDEVDEAIEEIVTQINEHKLAGSDVPQEASVEFYVGIADRCRAMAEAIREEMG